MKITRVSARNYRTLADFGLSLSRGYCPISGANNAGKTNIIKIIQHFLEEQESRYYYVPPTPISQRDKTQWSDGGNVVVSISIEFDRNEDAETFFFIETFAARRFGQDSIHVTVEKEVDDNNAATVRCKLADQEFDSKISTEIAKKLQSSANVVIHNSTGTARLRRIYSAGVTELNDYQIDEKDRAGIRDAETRLKERLKNLGLLA